VERQRRYARYANIRSQMNYYNCSENEAARFIPFEADIFRKRNGIPSPSEERWRRIMGGEDDI